ncbi:MAG: hypothetical protein U9N53_14465 [Bacteroidota bacterium]|nr:hypothetical protein [Bacteroidota bacterium]
MDKKVPEEKNLFTFYSERKDLFLALAEFEKKWLRRISWLRLFVFIVFIFFSVKSFGEKGIIFIFPALLFLSLFIVLIKHSIKRASKELHYRNLLKLNADELKALNHDYSEFDDGLEFSDRDHEYVFDLDIYGPGSLFQYLNRSFSQAGRIRLAAFFSDLLNAKEKIYSRQEAVKDLSARFGWIQNFQALCMQLKENDFESTILKEWLRDKSPIFNNILFPFLAYLLPAISIGLIGLSVFGIVAFEEIWYLLLIPLVVVGLVIKKTQSFQRDVSASLRVLSDYRKLFEHIEKEEFDSALLQKLKNELFHNSIPASRIIQELAKILDAFDTRNNMIVGVLLNAILLWDIHCLISFGKWRRKYAKDVFRWLESLSEFDALSSLGTFSFNHPDYSFPRVSEQPAWEFESLGHPLIKDDIRVNNDLMLSVQGEIFIVTGPNMAGKSTFLRAVGVNMVLSQMGAPVCASKFVSFPSKLFTSMRTTDSLQNNESYFFSELKRLKFLLDLILEKQAVFFLLDEILKGTNSKDKTSGSRAVITRLVDLEASGLIATHDLTLSRMEEDFTGKVFNKCFEAKIVGDKLKFDYKLINGVSRNMNATFLMRKMGIIGDISEN